MPLLGYLLLNNSNSEYQASIADNNIDLNKHFTPIFIVGFPRSGTTLLATILSRHSKIAVPPETIFMEEIVDNNKDSATMLARVANNRRCQDLGLDMSAIATKFADYPASYQTLFRILLESYTIRKQKEISAEKSPLHLLHVPTLHQWYPKARFIFIVRDGRDCVLSMLKTPWAHNSLIRHSAEWRLRMQLTRQLLKEYPQSSHLVSYENLVLSTEEELQKIMRFLQLPLEETQLQTSSTSTAVPEWEMMWKAKAQNLPDHSRVSSWKREASIKDIIKMESIIGNELVDWNYPLASDKKDIIAALLGGFYASRPLKALQRFIRKTRRFF